MRSLKRLPLIVLLAVIAIIPLFGASDSQSVIMDSYCFAPPFADRTVPPNIFFVIDASGSMSWDAYEGGYNASTTYEGYFIPTKKYRYVSANGRWEETSNAASSCPSSSPSLTSSSTYTGNCLNYWWMNRIDILRWATTGGRPSSCTGSNTFKTDYCDTELWETTSGAGKVGTVCNSSGCTILMDNSAKVFVPWTRLKESLTYQFQGLSVVPRMGGFFFSGSSVRTDGQVYVGDFTQSNNRSTTFPFRNLATAINSTSPSDATPSGPAMWDALNYFKQAAPQYGGIPVQSGSGDKWKNPMYSCPDKGGANCVLLPCAKNFIILISDGQWNRSSSGTACNIGTAPYTNSPDPVVAAYTAHMGFTNLKTSVNTNVEAVYTISLFDSSGTGRQSLKNVAMYGSFDKTSRTWPDSLSTYPLGACTMTDCGAGSGSGCTALPASSPDWDKNGDGKPDTYFSGDSAEEIRDGIRRAVLDALTKATSGSSTAAMPPSQSKESFVITQSYFYPKITQTVGTETETLAWLGYLRFFWADAAGYTREDTMKSGTSTSVSSGTITENTYNGILDLIFDKLIAFVYNTSDNAFLARQYEDTNGDSVPDSCSGTYKKLDADQPNVTSASGTVIPVAESGALLKAMSPADGDRGSRVWTWLDANDNGTYESGEFVNFKTNLASSLASYWSYGDATFGTCDTNCATSVIKYVLGYDRPTPSGANFRLRQTNNTMTDITNTWKLGDTIFSTPQISPNSAVNGYDTKYGDDTYRVFIRDWIKSAAPIAIVGANDGMVHAFRLGNLNDIRPATTDASGKQVAALQSGSLQIGAEEWAFIPKNVLPFLRWYCDKDYCHIPMADASFTIVDASIGGADDDVRPGDGSSWRRLLIGSMGFGGKPIEVGSRQFSSSIFVLDITPTKGGTQQSPKLLWESRLPDNTLTFGTPGIVRLKEGSKNGTWYLVIGSGASDITSASMQFTSRPKVFVFNLKTGAEVTGGGLDLYTVDNSAAYSAVGDFLCTDLDYPAGDYQSDDLYFGTYSTYDDIQKGKLYRLRIRDGAGYISDPKNWVITKAVNITSGGLAAADDRPVFGQPAVSIDDYKNIWIYFGTGLYVTKNDEIPTNEYLFGFKEKPGCWSGSGACSYGNFLDVTSVLYTGGQAVKLDCQCPGGLTIYSGVCSPAGTGCPDCSSYGGSDSIVSRVSGTTLTGVGACTGANASESAGIACMESTVLGSYDGWARKFSYIPCSGCDDMGMKLYASPLVAGGIVSTTGFSPSTDPCSFGGKSHIIALHYTTGTTSYQPAVIGVGGTSGSLTNLTIAPSTLFSSGAPPFKQSLIALGIGGGDGPIRYFTYFSQSFSVQPSVPYPNRFIQWITK